MKIQLNESQNEQSEVSLENIESKQSWRDDYIKWISAFQGKFALQPLFATFGNSDEGKFYIGVDDDGSDESKKFNGITPQFRWQNGLWVEFYFNQEKSLPNGLGEKLGDRLGNTEQNILALMQNNPKISITALASELGISTTAIENILRH